MGRAVEIVSNVIAASVSILTRCATEQPNAAMVLMKWSNTVRARTAHRMHSDVATELVLVARKNAIIVSIAAMAVMRTMLYAAEVKTRALLFSRQFT